MDVSNPFVKEPGRTKSCGVWELRQLGRVYFQGGYIDDSIQDLYKKYKGVLMLFEMCIHPTDNYYVRLPFEGAVLDQPFQTIECINVLRAVVTELRKKK